MMKGMGAFCVKASLYCLSKAPKQSFAKKKIHRGKCEISNECGGPIKNVCKIQIKKATLSFIWLLWQ